MSEKWMAEGRAEGETKKAKKVVLIHSNHGMPPESIADIVKMNITVVKRWLDGAAIKHYMRRSGGATHGCVRL